MGSVGMSALLRTKVTGLRSRLLGNGTRLIRILLAPPTLHDVPSDGIRPVLSAPALVVDDATPHVVSAAADSPHPAPTGWAAAVERFRKQLLHCSFSWVMGDWFLPYSIFRGQPFSAATVG